MKEQENETFFKKMMNDEEFYYEYIKYNKNWKNIIMINPDKSVNQIF